MDQELIALNLISNSGTARTKAFEALHKAREGKYEEAKMLLKESEESSLLAHNAQTELLKQKRMEIILITVLLWFMLKII